MARRKRRNHAPMESDPIAGLALGLAIILLAAKTAGDVALRLGAPAVVGELLVGVALAAIPVPFLQELGQSPAVDALSRLGAMILVFEVGLVLTVREVLDVGVTSVVVAVTGTLLTFLLGWSLAAWLLRGQPGHVPIFVGAAITATSIGITARVLKDLGQTRTREARIVLGAAVLDDVIGLVVLTVVSGWIATKTGVAANAPSLPAVVGKSIAVLGLSLAIGMKVAPGIFEWAARLKSDGALVAVGLAFCFGLAWAASMVGLAAIIGAFTAGLIVEEMHSQRFVARGERTLSTLIEPIASFLVPVFFVVMGMRTRMDVFREPWVLAFALGLTLAAVLGKLGAGLAVGSRSDGLSVGIGMVPRGEVSLIFASLGLSLGAIDGRIYSSLVVVVVLTTLVTPGMLKWSLRRRERAALRAPTSPGGVS
jgi:Kef-type K+ transport system membrane component KefB